MWRTSSPIWNRAWPCCRADERGGRKASPRPGGAPLNPRGAPLKIPAGRSRDTGGGNTVPDHGLKRLRYFKQRLHQQSEYRKCRKDHSAIPAAGVRGVCPDPGRRHRCWLLRPVRQCRRAGKDPRDGPARYSMPGAACIDSLVFPRQPQAPGADPGLWARRTCGGSHSRPRPLRRPPVIASWAGQQALSQPALNSSTAVTYSSKPLRPFGVIS